MNLRKLFSPIGLPLFLLFSLAASAQDRTVTGRVADSTGRGISGVTIAVKGMPSRGTTSTTEGTYSLSVPAAATTLVFSAIGYGYQEVDITGRTSADVVLEATSGVLNEVVMVAYGSRRRADLTGSVTSVSEKDFQKGVISSSEQLLQGKVAGLQITPGGGSAGGGSRIRIRTGASLNASNDPLIVIDGIPIEGNGIAGSGSLLNTINPNDIESISVLKDASATALYGSRASNGVLIITTKKGSSGKMRFNFNTTPSLSKVARKVEVLDGDEVRSIINADAAKTGNNTWKNLLGTANTDWQDEIFQEALGWDNNLSATGSIAGVLPFRASLGFYTQEGILRTNQFERYSASLNLSPRLFNNHLSVNLSLRAVQTQNVWADEGAVGSAVSFDPTKPVRDTAKKYQRFGGYYEWLQSNNLPIDLSTRNPVALLELRDNTSEVNRLLANVQLDYKLHFFPDLHVRVNLGSDFAKGSGNDNIDSTSATNYKSAGRYLYYQQKKRNQLADVGLFYEKEIPSIRSRFDVLFLHSYQTFVTNVYNYAARSQYKDTVITASIPEFPYDKPEYRLESYLGQINYTFAGKYIFNASLRRDASSKFAPHVRVGYFPAVAFAWRLKDEFLQNSNFVNDLKLRASWGVTGQQDIGNLYPYMPRYQGSVNQGAQYQLGDTFYLFLRPTAYDPDIRWEKTKTLNLGLDFSLLNNRIAGSVDVYKKNTEDLLSVIPIPAGTNFGIDIFTNVGNMETKGIEFALNTTPVKTRNFLWDFGFNITYSQSEITNLLKQSDASFQGIDVSRIGGGTGNNIGKFAVGYAPYIFNVYKQVYDQSGRPIEGLYEDINRDGTVDEKDKYLYKKPAPDVLLGLNTQFAYKKLTLGMSGHGALGNYAYNNYVSNSSVLNSIKNPINFIGNASERYLDAEFGNNQYFSDYYIENASFFRMDNIFLGYNFGRVWKDKASLTLTGTIQNAFLITKFEGVDPESASDTGVNGTIYPRPRIYSLRVNLDF